MASIQEKRKNGKIVSFKFRAFLGRDLDGKQQFKTKVWKPEKNYSEPRLWKHAEKEAAIWEKEVIKEFQEQTEKFKPSDILFADFVNEIWLPSLQTDEARATTLEFRGFILKTVLPYFAGVRLADIDSQKATEYLDYLKNERKNPKGKPLSAQTRKHHYSTLNLIFAYAVKRRYIEDNPMQNVESPKLPRHRVDAFTKSEVTRFIDEVEKLPLMQKTESLV